MTPRLVVRILIEQARLALPAREKRLFACRTARRILETETEGQGLLSEDWAAIEVAERRAVGQATAEELSKAHCAVFRATPVARYKYKGDTAAYRASFATADYSSWALSGSWPGMREASLQLTDLLEQLAR